MKTSILICATCLVVSGCSAQLRFPSLSSALSSLTGFGSSGGSGAGSSGAGGGGQSGGQSSSPYSGLVRDYGRNLMMAMSSIYPTLFKPPQAQQQQLQQQQQHQQQPQGLQGPQSPYDQFGSHAGGQSLFSSQSAPSFTFGGSTFSISPSLPFGSLTGGGGGPSGQAQPSQPSGPAGAHSPFSASFGSSINSPSSFGPLSNGSPFMSQSMASFAPATSYGAAFEAANGGGSPTFGGPGVGSMHPNGGPSGASPSGVGSLSMSGSQLLSQQSNPSQMNSYAPMQAYGPSHEASSGGSPIASQSAHQPQSVPLNQQPAGLGMQASYGAGPQQGQPQYSSQQYRPDMMLAAASAPVPSSNSYSNYGNIPSGPSQQAPASPSSASSSASSSYQQASYR